MKTNKFINGIALGALLIGGMSLTSCEDEPDKYEISGGTPTVQYVRLPVSADSIITERSMESTICLVGKNLTSIKKILFNDQVAVLNTSYMTDTKVLVDIPSSIPTAVTDKIYMINEKGDTTTYDFHVVVPAPTVSSMSCEYAQPGDVVTISGDYFIDDPYVPLEISFNDGTLPVTDIKSISKGLLTFTIPAGATNGYVYVKSVYGETKSLFMYQDNRNILFDFDGSHGGLTTFHGWRSGNVRTGGIDGSYLYFGGVAMSGKSGGTWAEDQFCANYWPDTAGGFPELSAIPSFKALLDTYDVSELQVKFECRVPAENAWSSAALQIIFTGNSDVTYATGSNGYYGNASLPRGLWLPWQTTGSYDTGDTWTTVTLPLSTFTKTADGQSAGSSITKDRLTGLTLFVWNGGIEGTDCTPELDIDNIRVVPIK